MFPFFQSETFLSGVQTFCWLIKLSRGEHRALWCWIFYLSSLNTLQDRILKKLRETTEVLVQGRPTLVLETLNNACFPALPGLFDADNLNQVSLVNQDGIATESANLWVAGQGELENRVG